MTIVRQPTRFSKPVFRDSRGNFIEQFNTSKIELPDFSNGIKQISESYSKPRTFRGFHWQTGMNKVLRVIRGSAHILTIELLTNKTNFFYLSELKEDSENAYYLYVPDTHAIGFVTWESTIMQYFHDDFRKADKAKTINYESVFEIAKKEHGEDWIGILFSDRQTNMLISDQDQNAPSMDSYFFNN